MRKKLDTQQYYDKYEKSRHSLGMFRMPARFDNICRTIISTRKKVQEYHNFLYLQSLTYLKSRACGGFA